MVTIKQAAGITGQTVKALRHYEKLGLCTPSARAENGYRLYSDADLDRLRQISQYRNLKFPLKEIAGLLDAAPEEIFAAMERQYYVVNQKLEEYRHAVSALDTLLGCGPAKKNRTGRTAIVGIDLQNDILDGGALPCKRVEQIIPVLSVLYQKARERGVPIIYICDCHKKGDPELLLWNDHMMDGTWGEQIIRELTPQPGDYVVNKNLFNGFVNTCLQDVLQFLNVHTILFTGWRTEVCVAQTAIDAFYRGYRVVIAEDGVNSTTEREHRQGISQMQVNYNFEMYPCAAALDKLLDT